MEMTLTLRQIFNSITALAGEDFTEEQLLDAEVKIRIPASNGVYTTIVSARDIMLQTSNVGQSPIIQVNTSMIY